MAVLKVDCGYDVEGDGSLLEAATAYIDALETLLVDTVERFENRGQEPELTPGQVPVPTAPKHRSSDPDASRKADLQNAPVRNSQRWKVLRYLAGLTGTGQTASEIAGALGMPLNSISTRMSELVQGGWVAVVGERGGKSIYVASGRAQQQFGQESSLLG